jgi:ureidoglycolate lyase
VAIPSPPWPEQPVNFLKPDVPPALPWHEVPLVRATPVSLAGYGELVDDPETFPVEVVTWPSLGWRPVDPGTGNQAGTVSGFFDVWWEGEVVFASNHAVDDQYLLGWSRNPGVLTEGGRTVSGEEADRSRVLLWHANYHPDGGQLFFPVEEGPCVVPLALPGDDITPGDFVAFYVEAGRGLYIRPGVWHEAVFPLAAKARFLDRQGRVHARVSCHFPEEFGVFLSVPLHEPRP